MLSISMIGIMTLKPIATKADSKIELTAGVSSYINAVMLGKIEPTVVENEPVVVEQTYEEPTVPTCRKKYSCSRFRKLGRVRYGDYTYTWYSQRVLPGGGLNIPGRHLNEHGLVVDENEYVVIASDDLPHGTVVDNVSEALPKDFNKARFVQNALALINDNPALQKYSQSQLTAGLLKGAYLGLDFYSKECYLVPYGNQLNYQTDYRGAKKLAKKYSIRPIKDIYAKLVRQGDSFEEKIVSGEQTFDFKPLPFNDGKIIGAFAVCLYADGGMQYDTMSLADLENTRKSSKASNSPAWKNFTGEMYKKTVLHRLCKHIELDFENPTQQNTFLSGMEIETDSQKLAENDIEQNANTVDFDEGNIIDVEPTDTADKQSEELPPFMQSEED